jgi:hypothetical protein
LGPAFAEVGGAFTVIVTLETDGGQEPLVIVHLKTFCPADNPVTVVLGKFGLLIVPLPETTVHEPVPTVGVLAERVTVCVQIDWLGPALDGVGPGLTVMSMLELVELFAQALLEITIRR